MRNAKKVAFTVICAVTIVVAACTDRPDSGMPTAPKLVRDPNGKLVMGACTTIATLDSLAQILFAPSSPNVNSVLGKLDNLRKKVEDGNVADAQAQAQNIVDFVRTKAAQGMLAGTHAQIKAFISGVLCYAGLSPDTYLIMPTDTAQIIIATDSQSGIELSPSPVGTPTLLTITTLDPTGPSPLITKLDQYPAYVDFTVSSPIVGTAVVAVCPAVSVPSDVRSRLRLGHQASTGFELTPHADGSFLPCGTSPSLSQSRIPGWLRTVASVLIPKPLYAQFEADRGGIGGSVTELSPFDAVDPTLSFSGGIGGSVTELIRRSTDSASKFDPSMQGTKGTTSPTPGVTKFNGGRALAVAAGTCTEVAATVGTALDPECRPTVTLTTRNGTIMNDVPVNWAVTAGGGTIAPDTISSQACGAYGSTAFTTTDALGKAAICWILGPNGGTNKSTATPTAGGDAPAGVTFSPAVLYFSAEGLKITPTATATGGEFTFDGLAHTGSGTCSNALTPALTYSGGAAPSDVGSYTLTVTCGEGSSVYNTVTATATITISAVTPTIALSCPASVVYDGSVQQPCTATVSAPGGLSAAAALTYSNNTNAGTATATASYAANGNYGAASGSTTFEITKAISTTAISCPASAVYTGSVIEPCTASTTGAGGLSTVLAPTYTGNVNAGTATATATYVGDANHDGSSASASFEITKATSATTVSCPVTAVFTGSAIEPCSATATGAGGLNAALPVAYASNVNVGTASATAAFAGDANHDGSNGSATFGITPAATSVAVNCPVSLAYDGTARNPCTATVSGAALSASLGVTYNPLSPRDAGGYTASASYPTGGNYVGSANAASFNIVKLAATATAGSATINFGAALPTIPCTVAGLLGVDAGAVTCSSSTAYTIAGTYPVIPIVSPPNPTNYSVTSYNGTLTVAGYVQVGCFASPLYSVMPDTKSAQRKGSNLPIKCTLQTPQGTAVTTAKGDIQVVDAGTAAVNPPVKTGTIVFSASNVFKVSTSGNYSYGLDTSPATFVAGHYYYVIANWNDGSKTEGWFLLK